MNFCPPMRSMNDLFVPAVFVTDLLNTKGYNVSHLLDYHDYPQYNGSYTRSYETVNNFLTSNNINPQVVLDIHRDAVRK